MTEKELLEKMREIYKENLTVLGKLRQQLQNKLNLKDNTELITLQISNMGFNYGKKLNSNN